MIKFSKLSRLTYEKKFSLNRIEWEKISRHPITERYNGVFKMSNIGGEISGTERNVKLGVISIYMMT
jgi:hypothetical protein